MAISDKSPESVWNPPVVEPLAGPDGAPVQDSAPVRNGELVSQILVDPVE